MHTSIFHNSIKKWVAKILREKLYLLQIDFVLLVTSNTKSIWIKYTLSVLNEYLKGENENFWKVRPCKLLDEV